MYLFKLLEDSRQEAIRDAGILVTHEMSRSTDKNELIDKLHKMFRSLHVCQGMGRDVFERSYYLVVCEQLEHHITMITESRCDAA